MRGYREAKDKYRQRLLDAIGIAVEDIPIDGVTITTINDAACSDFVGLWRDRDDRLVDWDWTAPEHRDAKGINMAIWHEGELCGLASGKLTAGRAVRIDFVERRPGENPLKGEILPAVLTCADAYGMLVNATEIRIHDVSEELVSLYESFGFDLAPEGGKVQVMRRDIE